MDKRLKKIIIIAVFTALCTAGTFVQIKMPAGDMIHLGNFVMIVAALLLGGIAGGTVGSLGMGIYDLIIYSSKPTTILRTFILKFIIGFLVGFLFRYVFKKKKNTYILFGIEEGLFTLIFILSLVGFILGDRSAFGVENGFNSILKIGSVSLKISLYIPIFSGIFVLGILVALIFNHKLNDRRKAALFAVTAAVIVNIIGEFILRWFLEGVMLTGFNTSIITATSKIPGSVITGLISVILSVLIYEPVYKAVVSNDLLVEDEFKENDDTDLIEE